MSIFNKRLFESFDDEGLEPIDVEAAEPAEVLNDEEVTESFLAVIESMHEHDVTEMEGEAKVEELEAEGAPTEEIEEAKEEIAVATEASAKEIFAKIKAALAAIWKKIVGFLNGIVKFFAQYILSAKQFIKAYGEKLKKLKLSGFAAEVYAKPPTADAIAGAIAMTENEIDLKAIVDDLVKEKTADIKNYVMNAEDSANALRNSILGKKTTAAEFKKALTEKYIGDGKQETAFTNGAEFIRGIEEAVADAAKAKNFQSKIKSANAKMNNELKYAESVVNNIEAKGLTAEKRGAILSAVQSEVSEYRAEQSVALQVIDVWRKCLVKYANSMKFAASKALSHK